jgi:hypothetical protein
VPAYHAPKNPALCPYWEWSPCINPAVLWPRHRQFASRIATINRNQPILLARLPGRLAQTVTTTVQLLLVQ